MIPFWSLLQEVDLRAAHPFLSFRRFLFPMLLEGLVCYSCAVHPLLLGKFLDPIYWIVLCMTRVLVRLLLFLRNSCSLFIFRKTLFLLYTPSLPPLLGPFSPLYLECLLCASSAPSFCRCNFVIFFAHFS